MKERDCSKCKYKRSRLEMVLPDCSGTVDYCKLGLDPKTCIPDDNGANKLGHLLRSIANQPNKLKSKRVKELLSKEEIDNWFETEGKTDKLNLGS